MAGLYFEEFVIGQKFKHEITRTVTEMDNVLFTCLTHNPQPLHLDAEFAAKTEFGKPSLYDTLPGLMAPWIFADSPIVDIRPPRWGDASGVRGAAWLWR